VDTKTCTVCAVRKDVSEFWRKKRRDGSYGLSGNCRSCGSLANRKSRENRANSPKAVVAKKMCRDCNKIKLAAEFPRSSSYLDGLGAYCKPCVKVRNKAAYDAHASDRRAYANRYRVENVEAVKASQAAWRERNREKARDASRQWRRDNPERLRAAVVDWLKRNPGKSAQYTENYRAKKIAAWVEDVEFSAVLMEHGSWCYLCESPIHADQDIHLDHVVPLSRGGEHSYANVRPTHSTCNLIKSNQLLSELELPFTVQH